YLPVPVTGGGAAACRAGGKKCRGNRQTGFTTGTAGRYDRSGHRQSTLTFGQAIASMGLPRQTIALLDSARQLAQTLPADAILLLTETNLDWDAVLARLPSARLLVAAQDGLLT